jgi:hypothetical protein
MTKEGIFFLNGVQHFFFYGYYIMDLTIEKETILFFENETTEKKFQTICYDLSNEFINKVAT